MDPEPWDAHRLRDAMAVRGHGPTNCASEVHEIDPECRPNKGSVIGWCSGKHRPGPRNRRALEQYIADASPPGRPGPGDPEADQTSEAETFDRLVESFTAEDELKGRQAAFIDALIQNLASGEFNEHYTASREQVARAIGLGSTL